MAPQPRRRGKAAKSGAAQPSDTVPGAGGVAKRRAAVGPSAHPMVVKALAIVRAVGLAMIQPQRVWLLVFLPSFVRYMMLLRMSLRPRPLHVGTVVEASAGSLAPIIPPASRVEIATEGLTGVLEAPVWRHDPELGRGYLLFSQVSKNRLWRWEEGGGAFTIGRSLFLNSAGCHQPDGRETCSAMEAPGVRGMALMPPLKKGDPGGPQLLVLCEHGNRRIARLEANGTRTSLAASLEGPRDALFSPEGDLFFTDSTAVWRLSAAAVAAAWHGGDGGTKPTLVAGVEGHGVGQPRALAFSPDYASLYVSYADAAKPQWRVYDLGGEGGKSSKGASAQGGGAGGAGGSGGEGGESVAEGVGDGDGGELGGGKLFADSTAFEGSGSPGGMQVDEKGNVYAAAGEKGVLIFDPSGKHLGTVATGVVATGVAFGDDGFLYITGFESVCRVRVLTKAMKELVL